MYSYNSKSNAQIKREKKTSADFKIERREITEWKLKLKMDIALLTTQVSQSAIL